MKRVIVITLFAVLLILFWKCSEKSPLDISAFSLKAPGTETLLIRSNLKSNGSFTPGYQNGKIRSDRITLDWHKSTDANFLCYKVYRNNVEIWAKTDNTVTSFSDSNLVQNNYYNYRIVDMNKQGLFQSDTIRLKTPRFFPPTNLNYQVLSATSVRIFWQNRAESASNFRIFRKQHYEPDFLYQQVGTSSDTSYVDNSVTNLEQYNYRIIAYNSYESTTASDPLYVYVNYLMNPPTLNLLQQLPQSRSVRVEWTDNSNAEDGFKIYRGLQSTNLSQIGTVPANITEYIDNDTTNSLQIGMTYYYAVTAYNQNEETSKSNIMSILISTGPSYIEIGNGTINWDYPFYTYYHDARTQIIYLSSEIGSAFTIRKIAFNVTQVPGQTMNNFVIRMKHTSLPSYITGNFDNSSYTMCLNTNLNITTTGWVEIPLTTQFNYNGVDNLIIDISFDNTSYTSSGLCFVTDTFYNRSIYKCTDSALGDPLFWSSGSLSTYIPNVRLFSSY